MKLKIKFIIFGQFIAFLTLVIAYFVSFLTNEYFQLEMCWRLPLIVLGCSLLSIIITPLAVKFFKD